MQLTRNTPMMQQYAEIKRQYQDAIVFFHLGDFYEMFFEDALVAARELEITLTSRDSEKKIPMAGVPCHAADNYIAQLLKKGYKVAICEQVEDPRQAKGIVRRAVTRVVTPGTLVEEGLLDAEQSNYLCVLAVEGNRLGLASVDCSTGEFMVTEFDRSAAGHLLRDELARLRPAECLFEPGLEKEQDLIRDVTMPPQPYQSWSFHAGTGYQILQEQFGTASLAGFGCEGLSAGIKAAGAALHYIKDNYRQALSHITALRHYSVGDYMLLDAQTRRNLELVERMHGKGKSGTLLWVLDETVTALGARLLRGWVEAPLVSLPLIQARHDAVEEMLVDEVGRAELRESLEKVYDLERLTARTACGSANARDLLALRDSLRALPEVAQVVGRWHSHRCRELLTELDELPEVAELLERAINDSPPLTITEGGVIKQGYDSEVDRLREIQRQGKDWITIFGQRERERTGIKSLKVGYNRVFGYYLEITHANSDLVPDDYIRKQTLANSERYITPELKEQEDLVLGAADRLCKLEYELFIRVREQVALEAARLQKTARVVAELDTLASLAEAAARHGFVRPEVDAGNRLELLGSRHPVLEQTLGAGAFVPNDCYLDQEHQVIILTGPNMAGKSTYLRQVALAVLMAQMGSFVPADQARISLVDRIFTRVGAADDLSQLHHDARGTGIQSILHKLLDNRSRPFHHFASGDPVARQFVQKHNGHQSPLLWARRCQSYNRFKACWGVILSKSKQANSVIKELSSLATALSSKAWNRSC
jgi:DNA mismatch repair protein MutS